MMGMLLPLGIERGKEFKPDAATVAQCALEFLEVGRADQPIISISDNLQLLSKIAFSGP